MKNFLKFNIHYHKYSTTNATKQFKRSQERFLKTFFQLLVTITFLTVLAKNLNNYRETKVDNFKFHVPIQNVPKTENKNDNIKYILFWTSWWFFSNWQMGAEIIGEEYLKSVDCPVTNCLFSHDRNFLPKPTDYDALVFHVGDFIDIDDLPEFRRGDQIYIMANEEPPFFSRHNLNYDKNFFNMTLTYRLDSDVFWNYGLFFDIETGSVVAPSKYARWREPEVVDDPELVKFITKSKTKLAAWFVSHCDAPSNREILTKKIQEFMEVDIYGECGKLTCPIGRTIYDKGNRQQCTDMLNSTYKFYFSFENSICVDYMTEKVYLNMENYIVPILYNGITDMQHFLPPHSYIHVNDSSSVEDLVNYLKYLDKNPQEYANYFWWKKYYKVTENVHKYSYCDMCMRINEWNVKKKRKEYLNISKWNSHRKCYNMGTNF